LPLQKTKKSYHSIECRTYRAPLNATAFLYYQLCAVIFSQHQAWDENLGSPGMERP